MKRTHDEMQNFIDQLPGCSSVPCKMEENETPPKRPVSENELKWFRPQISMPQYGPTTCQVDNATLEKLQEDVTLIRSNMEKKRHKVTLNQLNEKVDLILNILQSWNV